MLLVSAALGAVVLAGLLLGLTLRTMHQTRRVLLSAEVAERRHRAWSNERAGIVAARTAIADRVQAGTDTIQLGAGFGRAVRKRLLGTPVPPEE